MAKKSSPEGSADSVALENTLQSAARGETDEPLKVRLTVSGGVEGERFEFQFEGDEHGSVRCGMHCAMSGRDHPVETSTTAPESWQQALAAVGAAALEPSGETATPIPPDSLVGQLEVEVGGRTVTTIFMADEGQAETAGFTAPAGVLDAVDALYDVAARQLGAVDVRP